MVFVICKVIPAHAKFGLGVIGMNKVVDESPGLFQIKITILFVANNMLTLVGETRCITLYALIDPS